MASNIYPLGFEKIVEQGIDTMTCQLVLLGTGKLPGTYVYDEDHEFMDTGVPGTGCPLSCECNATDYVRKSVTPTVNLDTVNTRIEIVFADTTWTTLGNGTNDTITAALLIDYTGDDTTSPLLVYFDITNTITTNTDFVLDFDATNGNVRIPYTIN